MEFPTSKRRCDLHGRCGEGRTIEKITMLDREGNIAQKLTAIAPINIKFDIQVRRQLPGCMGTLEFSDQMERRCSKYVISPK